MFFTTRSESIRSRVTLDEIEGLQIMIPAARNRFFVAFGGLWLTGWAVGEVMALGSLIAMALGIPVGRGPDIGMSLSPAAFLSIWLTGWTVGGVIMLEFFFWQLRGREWIRIDSNGESLVVQRLGTYLLCRVRTFPLHEVRNLRFAPLVPTFGFLPTREVLEPQLQWFGSVGGNIAFDHAGGTARFGSQLSETESRRLIKTIKDHYKIDDDRDDALPVERL